MEYLMSGGRVRGPWYDYVPTTDQPSHNEPEQGGVQIPSKPGADEQVVIPTEEEPDIDAAVIDKETSEGPSAGVDPDFDKVF